MQKTPPTPIEVTEHLWIPMPDGTRLSARLWCPEGAAKAPVPALFEYIPYRKTDLVRARDARNHPYLAAQGFASLRVDMRGSGESEGQMPDMYAAGELADAHAVIEWIAAQPWCSGAVGMFGTSWGGTAALQAAIDAPPALKAVIAVCATHDRFADDIHHMGGSVLTETLEWGATLPAILAAPPTPASGPDWRTRWEARLAALSDPLEAWLAEETRDPYWRHGSVIHEAGRLGCPILAVGGWSDRYSNSVMSLLDARPDLVWGVVGPWGHHYPDHAHPGPGIAFQHLAEEWFASWLGKDAAAPDWPRLRAWVGAFQPPADTIDRANGEWSATDAAPSGNDVVAFSLSNGALTPGDAPGADAFDVPFDLRVGGAAGDTGYFGRFGGLPLDQTADDAASTVFETAPLEQDLTLFGFARLTLEAPAARTQIVVRLSDHAPDGTVKRVAFGLRNLRLDDTLTTSEDGRRRVTIRLPSAAYRFAAGHRIRVALSQSYWPLVWPGPAAQTVSLSEATLELPVLGNPPPLRDLMPEPVALPAQPDFEVAEAPRIRRWLPDAEQATLQSGWHQPKSVVHHRDTDTTVTQESRTETTIDPVDPLSAKFAFWIEIGLARPDGAARIHSAVRASASAEAFHYDLRLRVTWRDECLLDRTTRRSVPRKVS